MSTKDSSITTIKAIAIVGVVFHHLANRRLLPEVNEWLGTLQELFSWCVLAFFAVSGWLHALTDEKKRRPFREYALSKVSRLLLPFVLVVVAYATIWQFIQHAGLMSLRGDVPTSFLGKLTASLWPTGQGAVGQQLYFLPMLFAVSLLVHFIITVNRIWLPPLMGFIFFIFALTLFPHAKSTGFTLGVFVWGCFSYLGGFLLFSFRHNRMRLAILCAFLLVTTAWSGLDDAPKFFPLFLLASARLLRLASWPVLPSIGEASGTIYIYHTPFMLQPMMMIIGRCKGAYTQFSGSLLAAGASIAICSIIFYRVRKTRYHRILL